MLRNVQLLTLYLHHSIVIIYLRLSSIRGASIVMDLLSLHFSIKMDSWILIRNVSSNYNSEMLLKETERNLVWWVVRGIQYQDTETYVGITRTLLFCFQCAMNHHICFYIFLHVSPHQQDKITENEI